MRLAATTVVGTAGVLAMGITPASAMPTSTPISGVTLQNMWMHCNAYGGDYDEGDGWAVCYLPSGQTVLCTTGGCTISSTIVSPLPVTPRPIMPVIGPIATLGG